MFWWWRLMGIRIAFLAMLAVVVGCGGVLPGPAADEYPHTERAVAEIALATAGQGGPDVAPDDKPELGKCAQCNGTGKVGDGRTAVTCQPCGGDGRIDPDDISHPVPSTQHGEITLHITDVTKRGWPDKWYREQAQAFRDRGWKVTYEMHAIADKQSAYIDVCTDGQCWQFFGPIKSDHLSHLEITR